MGLRRKLFNRENGADFSRAEVLLCRKFFFVQYFLRHALRHADAVICTLSFTAEKVAALGIHVPIQVIPFGTTVKVESVTKAVDKPVKDVLFAGRLIERKGVEYLLHAIPIVQQTFRVHLHIVGVGDLRPRLKELASQLRIAEDVTFHGFVSNDELERLYREADVFVPPAIVDDSGDTEGLGVVLIEAIRHRTPVVASRVGGIVDIVKHEETGLLVDARRPDQLAVAIVRLLTDEDLRIRKWSSKVRTREVTSTGTTITDQLTGVYSRITEQPPHSLPPNIAKSAPLSDDGSQLAAGRNGACDGWHGSIAAIQR